MPVRFRKQPFVAIIRRDAARVAPALVALTLIGGCGESGSGPARSTEQASPTTTPTTPTVANRGGVAAAAELRRHGALIAGWNSATAMRDVDDCVPGMRPREFECSFAQGDGMEASWVAIRRRPDGTVTKVLAFARPRSGSKTSAAVERLLARDDREAVAPKRVGGYSCATSPRLEPDGRPSTDPGASGQRCTVVHRIDHRQHVRYVEFAADGTAVRDYPVPQR